MGKNTPYFSHDSNARNDEKILAVRMRLGAEGYGIYFMILERLRDQADYMSIKDYNLLAFDFRVSADKVKSVINDFGLFEFTQDGEYFYSSSFNNRMVPLDNIREQRAIAGRKSAEKRAVFNDRSTTVEQTVNDRTPKIQQRRVKKSKEEKSKEESKEEKLSRDFIQEDFIPVFDEWLEYKSQRKEAYKCEKSIRIAYENLFELSGGRAETAKLIVRQSIGSNWAGLFALKTAPAKQSSTLKTPQTWQEWK